MKVPRYRAATASARVWYMSSVIVRMDAV